MTHDLVEHGGSQRAVFPMDGTLCKKPAISDMVQSGERELTPRNLSNQGAFTYRPLSSLQPTPPQDHDQAQSRYCGRSGGSLAGYSWGGEEPRRMAMANGMQCIFGPAPFQALNNTSYRLKEVDAEYNLLSKAT